MKSKNISDAIEFAIKAHGTQVRKYSGEPYYFHTVEVMETVKTVPHTEAMLVAAILHDTVEDTPVTLEEVREAFGIEVATLVEMLTDVAVPSDGNRATRVAINRAHTAKASPAAQTIKLADFISNTKSIVAHDKNFAKTYLREKSEVMEFLTEGDPALFKMASDLLMDGILSLNSEKK